MATSRRRTVLFLTAALLSGCATQYASWEQFTRQPSYALPRSVPLVVSRSTLVQTHDDGGFADTVILVVQQDLREEGIEVHVMDARKDNPAPRIELNFMDWTEGSQAARYLTEGLVGQAQLRVLCRVFGKDGSMLMSGQITGHEGTYTSAPRGAAEEAGHSIAKALSDPKWVPTWVDKPPAGK
ncbi:MAG TPA: hypothetical protein VNN72_21160 [Polyangiaceae bacterium]|nr:hypothetical protein [Polyangiaceae bacterium]